jgi:hypothetical protein
VISELPYRSCVELLSQGSVGRVGVCTPGGPRIVPVNYTVLEESVVFRTAAYTELGTYGWNTRLAFEIDHLDYEYRHAWSVVALGRGEMVEDADELQLIRAFRNPSPWASGTRLLYIRLRWEELTGRRIGAGWPHNEPPVHRVP